MTKIGNVLFELLRAGLWGRSPETGLLPLNEAEWGQIYDMAAEHTIVGQVFQGICMLPDELMPPQEMLDMWVVHVDKIERKNRKMNETVNSLLTFFESQDLHPVLLKGQGVAEMYEQPLQRACGDIDLFFDDEEYDDALEAVKKAGGRLEKMPDGSYLSKWQGVEVEIHDRMLDIYNPLLQSRIRDMIERDGVVGNRPSPLMNMLILNTHILKHMIGPGIGLRQVADMARACFALDGQYDKGRFQRCCSAWFIEGWTEQLCTLLHDHLGVAEELLPCYDEEVMLDEQLLQKILNGGNFGQHYGEAVTSKGWKRKVYTLRYSLAEWGRLFRLAPCEAVAYVGRLVVGQFSG